MFPSMNFIVSLLIFLQLFQNSCENNITKVHDKKFSKEQYYNGIKGKSAKELKTELSSIIGNPHVLEYREIWMAFMLTDATPDGKVWDMYSDNPQHQTAYKFDFRKDKCSTYKKEGDCYNREHSFPKSWFSNAFPMYTDLFHIYPTDGYVNSKRGNLPFGEVGIFAWKSTNDSKIGKNVSGNYRGYVFEPNDAYKGDLARTYFYMVTAYENLLPTWKSPQLSGNKYPGFSDWSLQILLKWHKEDPVSNKEIERNEAVFKIQRNRNPFIDYPQLVEHIWGNQKSIPFLFQKQIKMEKYPKNKKAA